MDDGYLFRYSILDLTLAVPIGTARSARRILTGRPTFVELECLHQIRNGVFGSLAGGIGVCCLYGVGAAFVAASRLGSPEAFWGYVRPYLGSFYLTYLIPYAITSLVGVKGVVAIVSDIAAMRLSGELDALAVLGLDPAAAVFVPRALALIIAGPSLAIFGIYAGAFGCWLGANWMLGVSFTSFWADFCQSISPHELIVTLLKMFVIVFVLAIVAGLRAFQPVNRIGEISVSSLVTGASASAALAVPVVNMIFRFLDETGK